MKKDPHQAKAGELFQAAASPSRDASRPPASSRDATREEKVRFLEVCNDICPGFRISDSMARVLNNLVRWCLRLDGPLDPDKGLWLWGDIGTGKSTMLEIIREYCRIVRPPECYRDKDRPRQMHSERWAYGFRISNASYVAGRFARDGYNAIEEYIINCRQAFDEVGRECIPVGYFGNQENVFQYLLQRRYDLRKGDFTHVTSNLSPEQIGAVYGDHIADRCYEMFNFVQMEGESWR